MRNNVPETYEDTLIIKKMIAERRAIKIDPPKVYDPNAEKEAEFLAMIEADMAKPSTHQPVEYTPTPLTDKIIYEAKSIGKIAIAITVGNILNSIGWFDMV